MKLPLWFTNRGFSALQQWLKRYVFWKSLVIWRILSTLCMFHDDLFGRVILTNRAFVYIILLCIMRFQCSCWWYWISVVDSFVSFFLFNGCWRLRNDAFMLFLLFMVGISLFGYKRFGCSFELNFINCFLFVGRSLKVHWRSFLESWCLSACISILSLI